MTATRFIHTSDWQIGMKRGFLPQEAHDRFDHDRLEAIARIGELAEAEECEFIIAAGDVFDANSLASRTINRTLEVLRGLPVPIYVLPGNHDPLVADNVFKYTSTIENVRVIRSSEPISVARNVSLVGAPMLAMHASCDLVQRSLEPLEPSPPGHIRIGVGHGQTNNRSAELDPALIDLSYLDEALAARMVDYYALGDTHSAEQVGYSGRVWYSGSPEVTDFHDLTTTGGGENNSGNVLVVDIEASGNHSTVEVCSRSVGTWTWQAVGADVNNRSDAERFIDQLRAYPDKARTVIKYSLHGTVDLSTWSYLEGELAELEDTFANLYRRERTFDLHVLPSEAEIEELPLHGYAREVLRELIELRGVDPAAEDALGLLYRLAHNLER